MKACWLICFILTSYSVMSFAKIIEFEEQGPDVQIPISIWNQFGAVGGKNAIVFTTVTVRLKEKNPGVLIDSEIIFKFPRGGGEIDFSKYVKAESAGTFYVFFEFDEIPVKEKQKAYFVSQARKRKIDDDVWGAGCNKYMDIKNFIYGPGLKTGIEVNTTRNRHLSVLGGTFFFANDNKVAQVSFKDSTQAQLMCEE